MWTCPFLNERSSVVYISTGESWNDLTSVSDDAGSKFELFLAKFLKLIDLSFPNELIKFTTDGSQIFNTGWLTDEIVKRGEDLRFLYMYCKRSNNELLWQNYKLRLKEHRELVNISKKNTYSNFYNNSSNKTKASWQIINNESNTAKKQPYPAEFVNADDSVINDFNLAAKEFNNYFIESANLLSSNTSLAFQHYTNNCNKSMFLEPITEYEVHDILRSVSCKHSGGIDGIPCSLLIKVSEFISPVLTYLINKSFLEGNFPSQLKLSVVRPIHKKDNINRIENYRPISLLTAFSKVYERAFYSRLNGFLNVTNIIPKMQFGFRKGCSTADAIVSFVNAVIQRLDDKCVTMGIFFDYSRAFDLVNHSILLEKLEYYGVRGIPLKWIKSYLTGRRQKVVLHMDGREYHSDWRDVVKGVPQGSVLGPLLFLVYTADVVTSVSVSSNILYADDMTSLVTSNSLLEAKSLAGVCIGQVLDYCKNSDLVLNLRKTLLMHFSIRNNENDVFLNVKNHIINQAKVTRFLGTMIDNNLTWSAHIDYVLKKLAVHSFVIWKLRATVDRKILMSYYYAYIYSLLNYAIVVWGNCKRVCEVLIAQKRIVRTIFFKGSRESCRPLFVTARLLTVVSIYILQCALYVHGNFNSFLLVNDMPHNYPLRNNLSIRVPAVRLSATANSSYFMPIKIYNHLPSELRRIGNINCFKRKLKVMLSDKSFYNLKEFFSCNFV